MIDAKYHAAVLLEECRQPLGTLCSSSLLAVSPDYTAEVLRAAIEIAYELGTERAPLPTPERFREGVNRLAFVHREVALINKEKRRAD